MSSDAHSPTADVPLAEHSEPGLLWPRIVVCAMFAVFVAACALPAINVEYLRGFVPGWMCLTFGVIFFPLWLANPLFFVGCCFLVFGRHTAAFLWSLPGAFIAIMFFPPLRADLSWGVYLWFTDMVFLALFAGARAYVLGDRESHPVEKPYSPGDSEMAHEMNDEHDVVRVYAGTVVTAELYQQALKEAGIESKVVGLSLTASFGTAIPGSVELWVKSEDAEKAQQVIKEYEADKGVMAEEPETP